MEEFALLGRLPMSDPPIVQAEARLQDQKQHDAMDQPDTSLHSGMRSPLREMSLIGDGPYSDDFRNSTLGAW